MNEYIESWHDEKEHFELKDGFHLRRAEGKEFGVYETIYSNMDLELSFSWNKQTNRDNSSDLFWIIKNTTRIGGIHLSPNRCGSFFMITPYIYDRYDILNVIHYALLEWSDRDKEIKLYGVTSQDVGYYSKLGYQIVYERRVMIRPTRIEKSINWSDEYTVRTPSLLDVEDLGQLFHDSYNRGIDYKVFGQQNLEEATANAKRIIEIYESNDTLEGSILVFDKKEHKLIAACIAGISGYCDNDFSEIGDVVVNPWYRKLGLATKMIQHSLSNLHSISPATILCVTVGNPAEHLYRKIGFFPGIKFASMVLNESVVADNCTQKVGRVWEN
jgi:ribosomal protein S18 acetylase RimI-like enzyme